MRRNLHWQLVFLLTLIAARGSAAEKVRNRVGASSSHDYARWEQVIRDELDGKLAGGYVFEVWDHGRRVAGVAQGLAREAWEKKESSLPWTFQTLMPVASISKTITTVALLRLWEEKKRSFSLDDPFWPHIKRLAPEASDEVKQITIRQLLMHKSGFTKRKSSNDVTSNKELVKLLADPLANKPGEKYVYDNSNFYIARLLIEEIGHVEYVPYVKEHVLRPMGIDDMETRAPRDHLTCGYGKLDDYAGDEKKPGYPFDWRCTNWAGAAGWYGSADDMGKLLAGIRQHRVLSADATITMFDNKMGWDIPRPGFGKEGRWFSGLCECRSGIMVFPDEVDAVLLINSKSKQNPLNVLADAWTQSKK